MKPIILAATLALSGLETTPLLATALQPLTMNVTFTPNPPKQGTETITVQLSDGSHKAVNGANVNIATSMPSMSMTGPFVKAVAQGNGRYVASVKLAFATRWAFSVSAQSNGKTVKRTIAQDVK